MSEIEYRPQLGFDKERFVKLEDKNNTQQVNQHILSEPIQEMLEISPTDLYTGFQGVKERAEGLVNKIIEELRGSLAKGPTIDEYIKAREENDTNVLYEFEDYHDSDIEGSTKAEMLPVILNIAEEAEALAEVTNQEFFDGEATLESIEKLKQQEEVNTAHILELDKEGKADIDRIAEDNHLKEFLSEKIENANDHLDQADNVFNQDLNTAYIGQAGSVIQAMTQGADMLDHLGELNKSRFNRYAQVSVDAKNRMNRLSNLSSKLELISEIRELQKKKLKNREVLQWAESLNIDDEDPLSSFVLDILEGVSETNDLCDKLVQDLYSVSQLDDMQMQDFFGSLENKQSSRDVHHLKKDMQHSFDFKDTDKERQIKQFGKNTNIDTSNTQSSPASPLDKQHHH